MIEQCANEFSDVCANIKPHIFGITPHGREHNKPALSLPTGPCCWYKLCLACRGRSSTDASARIGPGAHVTHVIILRLCLTVPASCRRHVRHISIALGLGCMASRMHIKSQHAVKECMWVLRAQQSRHSLQVTRRFRWIRCKS